MSDPRFNRIRDYQAAELQSRQPASAPGTPSRSRRFRWRYVLIPAGLMLVALPLGRHWADPLLRRVLHSGDPKVPTLRGAGRGMAARPPAGLPVEQIQLEVVNNCGVDGLGGRAAKFLRDCRFDVTGFSTGKTHSPLTLVLDRLGNGGAARLVAQTLGLPESRIRRAVDSSLYLHCTVIIGADYKSLRPFGGNAARDDTSELLKDK